MADVDKHIYCRDDGPGFRVLTKPFYAYSMTAPEGFRFDGASTPGPFKTLIPKFERTLKASCRHDWACRNAKNANERKEADKIFRRMLKDDGVGSVRRWCGYLGVRVGAWLGVGVRY